MSGSFAAWDDRHRIALVNGALMFFLIFILLGMGTQVPIVYVTNPILITLLWLAARRVNKRVTLSTETATA